MEDWTSENKANQARGEQGTLQSLLWIARSWDWQIREQYATLWQTQRFVAGRLQKKQKYSVGLIGTLTADALLGSSTLVPLLITSTMDS